MTRTARTIDGSIYRFLTGRATEADERRLLDWLETSDKNRSRFFELAAIHTLHRTLASKELDSRRDAMLHRLNARIDADETMRRQLRRKRFALWRRISIAAAIAAAIVTTFFLHTVDSAPDAAEDYRIYTNTTGTIAELFLEDNTRVWLQNGTELQYAVDRTKGDRRVRLNGEAYFRVTPDAERPFIVATEHLHVRVLGTSFNVRAAAGNPKTEVMLESGSVRLQDAAGNNLLRLQPNQRAVHDAEHNDIVIETVYAPHYITRHYDLVTISYATIAEIIARVEENYDVRLRIPDPNDTKRYDINFLRSNSLEEVLDIIEVLCGQRCSVVRNE